MSRTRLIRREMRLGSAALGAGMLSLARRAEATTDAAQQPGSSVAVVSIAQGSLHGTSDGKVMIFKRVPYAANPFIAANRFKAPQAAPSWTGARDASQNGPMPPQPSRARGGRLAGEPDDLTLNIWAPAKAQNAPVFVWFPGGAFYRVDAAQGWYDGSSFANQGIVVVTVNYRVGGNADDVTIAGQSAGAQSMMLLMGMPDGPVTH